MYSQTDIEATKRYQKSVNRDYFPSGLDSTQIKAIKQKIGYINNQAVSMPYQFSGNAAIIDLKLANTSNTVVTPIIGYSGLVVEDQDGKKIATTLSAGRTLSVHLPKGTYRLRVYYSPPVMIKCRYILSVVVSLVGIGRFIVSARTNRRKSRNVEEAARKRKKV